MFNSLGKFGDFNKREALFCYSKMIDSVQNDSLEIIQSRNEIIPGGKWFLRTYFIGQNSI